MLLLNRVTRSTRLRLTILVFLLVSVRCDTAQALVFLLVSVRCDTANALLVSVCCDTAQALVFLLVSVYVVTQPKPCCSCWCQCVL